MFIIGGVGATFWRDGMGWKVHPCRTFCIWHIHLHLVAWICLRYSEHIKHILSTGGFSGLMVLHHGTKCKKQITLNQHIQNKKTWEILYGAYITTPMPNLPQEIASLKGLWKPITVLGFGLVPGLGCRSRWQFASLTRKLRSCLGRSFNSCRFHSNVRPCEKKVIQIPSRGLTYPTWGKGKSSSKCHFGGIC